MAFIPWNGLWLTPEEHIGIMACEVKMSNDGPMVWKDMIYDFSLAEEGNQLRGNPQKVFGGALLACFEDFPSKPINVQGLDFTPSKTCP